MAEAPTTIQVKVSADTLAAMESVKELIRDTLVNYSTWLDVNEILGQSVELPATLTHDELVTKFLEHK